MDESVKIMKKVMVEGKNKKSIFIYQTRMKYSLRLFLEYPQYAGGGGDEHLGL